MSVYMILDTQVHNPEAYEAYKKQAGPLVEKFGGRYLVRGGEHEVLEGNWNPTRLVVVEFPDKESFEKFSNSPEYSTVRTIRHENAHTDLVLVQGI